MVRAGLWLSRARTKVIGYSMFALEDLRDSKSHLSESKLPDARRHPLLRHKGSRNPSLLPH